MANRSRMGIGIISEEHCMVTDSGGKKISPRQKAAEILLSRLGDWMPVDQSAERDMTDREFALVDKQLEKTHKKIISMLEKARKDQL